MSAPLFSRVLTSFSSILRNSNGVAHQVREASKKAGTSTRNKRKNTPGKHRGWYKVQGDYVERGMWIYRQLGLRVYPGLNVGCSNDMTLYALEPGRVVVSCQQHQPYPHSPLYPAVKRGRVWYRRFYHVIPDTPQEPAFKLVSQV